MNNLANLRFLRPVLMMCFLNATCTLAQTEREFQLKQITHQENYEIFDGQANDFMNRFKPNTGAALFNAATGTKYVFDAATWGALKDLQSKLDVSELDVESYLTVLHIMYGVEQVGAKFYLRLICFPDIAEKQPSNGTSPELEFKFNLYTDISSIPAITKVFIPKTDGSFDSSKTYADVESWITAYRTTVKIQSIIGDMTTATLGAGEVKGVTIPFAEIEYLAKDCGIADNKKVYFTNVAKPILKAGIYYFRHTLAMTDRSPVDHRSSYAANLTTMCPPQCGVLTVRDNLVSPHTKYTFAKLIEGQKSIEDKSRLIMILLLILMPLVGLVFIMTFMRLRRKQ